jgi:16S rRNA (uracil1498-N3)-methyltransferase
MSPRLFVDPSQCALAAGVAVAMPEAAAHHALRVVRMREGDALTLFDGTGGEWQATIASADKRGATVAVEAHRAIERESPLAIRLAIAILATDAMDYAVRKSVELGVAAIDPVVAARSQGAARSNRAEHWRRIVIAACEQCGRNRVPSVAAPRPLDDWLASRDRAMPGIVLAPGVTAPLASVAAGRAIDLLVGPEGGFESRELDAALRAGLRPVAMGPRVLKSETACVAAIAALQSLAGDWR